MQLTTRVFCKVPKPCWRCCAVVDNLAKRREALPHLAGVYFVTPTEQSARLILEDWKARTCCTTLF